MFGIIDKGIICVSVPSRGKSIRKNIPKTLNFSAHACRAYESRHIFLSPSHSLRLVLQKSGTLINAYYSPQRKLIRESLGGLGAISKTDMCFHKFRKKKNFCL